jgi:hypothetical protein
MIIVCGVLQSFEGVRTCLKSESLATIMERIVKAEVCLLALSLMHLCCSNNVNFLM